MSVTPTSMWLAVKAMLHSVFDSPTVPRAMLRTCGWLSAT